ncbi:hypothetical protein NX059_006552 [Plenodomus lindquistii]|nr:hypothetical protein NX059_006552 [Plenodomus lindquistii]
MTTEVENMDSNIRMDLLYRLRWDLRANLHDVKIMAGHENEEQLVSLFDHSCANESLASPGLSNMEISSAECDKKYEASQNGTPDPDGYFPPPSLFINNEDGKPITLGQFVTQVHEYVNEHIEEIKGALRTWYTSSVEGKIFFKCAHASGTGDDDVKVSVSLMPEMDRERMDRLWAVHLGQAHLHAKQRGRHYDR